VSTFLSCLRSSFMWIICHYIQWWFRHAWLLATTANEQIHKENTKNTKSAKVCNHTQLPAATTTEKIYMQKWDLPYDKSSILHSLLTSTNTGADYFSSSLKFTGFFFILPCRLLCCLVITFLQDWFKSSRFMICHYFKKWLISFCSPTLDKGIMVNSKCKNLYWLIDIVGLGLTQLIQLNVCLLGRNPNSRN
jgi:hypothetical protein